MMQCRGHAVGIGHTLACDVERRTVRHRDAQARLAQDDGAAVFGAQRFDRDVALVVIQRQYAVEFTGSTACKDAIRRQRPDGGTEVETEWHKIVTFGRQAELSRDFVSKGRLLYVEGRLQSQKWQDAQGVARRSFEVVADRVVFLERKPAEAGVSGRSGGTEPSAGDAAGAGAQDVPF